MPQNITREEDFPAGHPARFDHDPNSPEAIEWRRVNVNDKGEPAYPANHPLSLHPELNEISWQPGVDPFHPEREAFTGREPKEQAAAIESDSGQQTLSALDSRAQGE